LVNPRKRNNLEDPGVDGRIIIRWIFRKWDGSMDLIDLAQDKNSWRALINAVRTFGFHKTRGIS
jgi:hypothetical protein